MAVRLAASWVPDVALGQAGVFTARQAMAAGCTPAQVRRRRESGRWVIVAGSALASSELVVGPWEQAHAVRLTWPEAVVCLGTAALLHRLPVPDDGLVHVTVTSPRAARGVLTPHQLQLVAGDVVRAGQASVTSRRRTVLDCLGRLDDDAAESLAAWVLTRGLLGPDELERAILAHPHAWGNVRRRRALRDLRTGATGAAERRLHRLLRTAGITGWRANEPLHAHLGIWANADVYFPDCRLVIEVDGAAFHGVDQFQRDRTRQNELVTAGCTVLRFTWDDLTRRPDETVELIRAALNRLRETR